MTLRLLAALGVACLASSALLARPAARPAADTILDRVYG